MKYDFFHVHLFMSLLCTISYLILKVINFNFALIVGIDLSFSLENLFFFSKVMFILGCGVFLCRIAINKRSNFPESINNILDNNEFKSSPTILLLLILVYLLSVLYVYYISWGLIFYRYEYQLIDNDSFGVFYSFFEMVVCFFPGFILFYSQKRYRTKFFIFIISSISIIYLYGAATKLAGVCIIIIVTASFFKKGRFSKLDIALIFLSYIALSFVFNQRFVGVYGIFTLPLMFSEALHYPQDVFGYPLAVISSPVTVNYQTVLLSTARFSDFLTEINPLPGRYTDWYYIYENLRVNYAIPFSANGTLFSLGVWYLFIYGVILEYSSFLIYKISRRYFGGFSVFLVIVYSLFIWNMSAQYNLRASMRFIYLIIFIYFAITSLRFVKRLKFK